MMFLLTFKSIKITFLLLVLLKYGEVITFVILGKILHISFTQYLNESREDNSTYLTDMLRGLNEEGEALSIYLDHYKHSNIKNGSSEVKIINKDAQLQ